MTKERRLGRGLAALLGTPLAEAPDRDAFGGDTGLPHGADDHSHSTAPSSERRGDPLGDEPGSSELNSDEGLLRLNVYEIDDNPFQPRRDFSEPEIASLAESLKEHDMLQPILVRRVNDRYQLISGERRLRAAIQAGWSVVPARLRVADDRLVAELAIVENLQRQDLNPIEKAMSFKRYLDEHQCPQEDLARRLKIDRSTIANLMRLLELPAPVQESLRTGNISAGHARALLPLGDEHEQISFCDRIRKEGLSVRDTERMVQEKIQAEDAEPLAMDAPAASAAKRKRTRNEQIASLEQELRIALGTKVEIRQTSRGRGRITIHFHSHDEFERLRETLTDTGLGSAKSRAG